MAEGLEKEKEVITENSDGDVVANDDFLQFVGEEVSEPEEDKPEFKEEVGEKTEEEIEEGHDETILLEKINQGENISDKEIEFLRSQGHEIEVEESGKEEEKPEEKVAELPEFVDEIKEIKFFEGMDLSNIDGVHNGLLEYVRNSEKTNEKLVSILNDNPQISKVLMDLSEGKKDELEIMREHYGDLFEEDSPEPTDPGYKDWLEKQIKSKEQRKQSLKAEQERQSLLVKNSEISKRKAQERVKARGFDDKQAEEYYGLLNSLFVDASNLVVSDKMLDLIEKGLSYESDLSAKEKEAAEKERLAEIRGMNRKITLKKAAPKGDGLKRVNRHESSKIKSEVSYADKEAKELEEFLNS